MKKLTIVLLILVAVGTGVYLYLRQHKLTDFEPLIREKLSRLVNEGSHGLYHLDIGELHADVVGSRITIVNVHLRPDTNVYAQMVKLQSAPNDLFDVTISQLSLDDIVPAQFVVNKAISLRRLFINEPVVKVWHKKQSYNIADTTAAKTVYQQLQDEISSIKVDTLIVQNIDFIYLNKSKGNKETRLQHVKVMFADILLDSSTQLDHDRFLFAKNCLISLKDYTVNTANDLYRFKVGDIEIHTGLNAMLLRKIELQPLGTPGSFYKKIGHQQDRFQLVFDKIDFKHVSWWEILAEESFLVQSVSISQGSIKIFNDKSQKEDKKSKVGKYPHQILMKVPFSLKLDTLSISNVDLSYTELNPKSGEKGTLIFDHVYGIITNITNSPDLIKKQPQMRVVASASFMKQAPLKATFLFDLSKAEAGRFNVTAALGAMPGVALNAITIPLGLVKINSLQIESLNLAIKGDNNQAGGTVKMIYKDLNITALKAAGDTLKKRGLLSFVANNFVIKNANPLNGSTPRISQASYKRNPQRSFFNLVWKTVFDGAGKTVGYNKK